MEEEVFLGIGKIQENQIYVKCELKFRVEIRRNQTRYIAIRTTYSKSYDLMRSTVFIYFE